VVTGVDGGSAARAAGLQTDDVILEYDRKTINSAAQFQSLYLHTKRGGKVILLIFRQRSTMYLLLER